MTTSRLNLNRGEELGEFVLQADGALGSGEIRVIALKALSKDEILTLLRGGREAILQRDIPRI